MTAMTVKQFRESLAESALKAGLFKTMEESLRAFSHMKSVAEVKAERAAEKQRKLKDGGDE